MPRYIICFLVFCSIFGISAETFSCTVFSLDQKTEPVDYIFGILHSVAQGQATHWSIVYDLSGKRIYFETSNNSAVRFADLSKFNFSCSQPLLAYDLFDSRSGNISDAFKPYTITESRKRVMEVNSLYKFSPANIEIIVQYPKSMQCE